MNDRWRELERMRDEEDELTEIQFLSEQARLPGRVGWLANRRREFLVSGKAPRIEPQPWFDDVIQDQLEYWLRVGLSCEPANRQAAEKVISGFYRRLGKERPQFVWALSPLAANQAIIETRNLGNLGNQLRTQLRTQLITQLWTQLNNQLGNQLDNQLGNQLLIQLGNQLYNQLWAQLRAQLYTQLGTQLRTQLGNQLWTQLWDQLGNQLETQLWTQLNNQLDNQLRNQLGNRRIFTSLWGSLDAYWIGHRMAARELGVCYPKEDLDLLREWDVLAHSCFWWWPYEKTCFISDRPREIEFNENGRLSRCVFSDRSGIVNSSPNL